MTRGEWWHCCYCLLAGRRRGRGGRMCRMRILLIMLTLLALSVDMAYPRRQLRTMEELEYYDNLRLAGGDGDAEGSSTTAVVRNDSYVIGVTTTRPLPPRTAPTTDDEGPSSAADGKQDNHGTIPETIRLCDLTLMMPLSVNGANRPDSEFVSSAAAVLAATHFNERNAAVVPSLATNPVLSGCNVKITLDVQDSRFSPIGASRVLIDDILTRNHSLATPIPCGIVGPERSAVSQPLSQMASMHDIPIVSHSATSTQLDNKWRYPLFGRTVPSDEGDAVAAASYFGDVLNVTHCGVLYVQDSFGVSLDQDFRREADIHGISVVSASYNIDDKDNIRRAVRRLRSSGYNYFFGVFLSSSFDTVMRIAYEEGLAGVGKSWLLTSGMAGLFEEEDYYDGESDLVAATKGLRILLPDIHVNPEFDREWEAFQSDVDALREYYFSKLPEHINVDSDGIKFPSQPTHWEYLLYDAVVATGIAACEQQQEYFNGRQLFQSVASTTFRGASGNVNFFDGTHDYGTRDFNCLGFTVVNIDDLPPDDDGRVYFQSREVAEWKAADGYCDGHGGLDGTATEKMVWNVTADTIHADGTTDPPPVLPVVDEDYNLISPLSLAVGNTIAGSALYISVVCATWTIVNRRSSVVRRSQPGCLLLLCLGTFFLSCSALLMGMQEPRSKEVLDAACIGSAWLFQGGVVLTFTSIIGRTHRVNEYFTTVRGFRRRTVSDLQVMAPFIIFAFFSIVILVTGTIVAPPEWVRVTTATDSLNRTVSSHGTCGVRKEEMTQDRIFLLVVALLDIVMLIVMSVETWRARNIKSTYTESNLILISLGISVQAYVLGILALWASKGHPTALFFSQIGVITVLSLAFLLPTFLTKESARQEELIRQLRKQTKAESVSSCGGDARSFSEIKRELAEPRTPKPLNSIVGESEIYFTASAFGTADDVPPEVGSRRQVTSYANASTEYEGNYWSPGLDDLAL